MSAHDFCRLLLRNTLADMRAPDPVRTVTAEIDGKVTLGRNKTFWVKVRDHRDPKTGTRFPSNGEPGHARFRTYEVEGCCAANAKTEALNKHEHIFNPDPEDQ